MLPQVETVEIEEIKVAVRLMIAGLNQLTTDPRAVTPAELIETASHGTLTLPRAINTFMVQLLNACRKKVNPADYQGFPSQAQAIAEELLAWWRATVNDGIPTQNSQTADFYVALDKFIFLQATFDLLAGKLHRLDPVIGDLGCQWRVPFVLDAQEALLEAIRIHFAVEPDDLPGLIGDIVGEYNAVIDNLIQEPDFEPLLKFEILCSQADQNKGKKAKAFQAKAHATLRRFFKRLKQFAPLFTVAHECSREFFAGWKNDIFHPYSAKDYLICAKSITYRTRRRVDCFGLSSVPEVISLPYTKNQLAQKYNVLAACSLAYMRHVATFVCEHEQITITELVPENTGPVYGNEGDQITLVEEPEYHSIYNYGNGANTLCASVHKVLQKTYRTSQGGTSYDTHLFFAPLRLIFMYQHAKGQPIIIDHRRLKCTVLTDQITYGTETFSDAVYELLGSDILYFEPVPNGGYVYVPNPTLKQQKKVGMCVETYSIITDGDTTVYPQGDDSFKSEDWNLFSTALKNAPIVNLILMAAAIHPELPGNTTVGDETTGHNDVALNAGMHIYGECTPLICQNPNAYLQTMSGNSVPLINCNTTDWSIVAEKNAAMGLLNLLGVTDTEYRHMLPGRVAGRRIISTIPFGAIHIYGCTFEVKVQEMIAMLENPEQIQLREGGVRRLMESNLDIYRPF